MTKKSLKEFADSFNISESKNESRMQKLEKRIKALELAAKPKKYTGIKKGRVDKVRTKLKKLRERKPKDPSPQCTNDCECDGPCDWYYS